MTHKETILPALSNADLKMVKTSLYIIPHLHTQLGKNRDADPHVLKMPKFILSHTF